MSGFARSWVNAVTDAQMIHEYAFNAETYGAEVHRQGGQIADDSGAHNRRFHCLTRGRHTAERATLAVALSIEVIVLVEPRGIEPLTS
jgi:hypothetical protein